MYCRFGSLNVIATRFINGFEYLALVFVEFGIILESEPSGLLLFGNG